MRLATELAIDTLRAMLDEDLSETQREAVHHALRRQETRLRQIEQEVGHVAVA